ncbi:biotin--[acetyl-CoA-carboxylase] ligase [Candidatus Bathyarchaeota archaeon]|nr:biotin--[acetyl-CoA-carboxylase] ligase [Candidatus Bathyarchaeota archaeon]
MPQKMSVNKLQEGLRTRRLGRSILFSREVDSTNKWAKKLAIDGAQDGTVVIAETQTEGRGRFGRRWVSPRGGLWFSLILRPKLHPSDTIKLNFVAGLAVAKILRELFSLNAETKWPNDVLVNKLKICGVLSEVNSTNETVNFAIVGVGLNVNLDVEHAFPKPLRENATSIEKELCRKVQLEEVFKSLLEVLEDLYRVLTEKGFEPILKEWKRYASFLGHQVEVTDLAERLSGLALDVDHEGALLLKLEEGDVRRVIVGDVTVRAE